MNWRELNNIEQLEMIKLTSKQKPVLIFKHSTRCSISATAKSRVERAWNENFNEKIEAYYLDLISHRDVSNKIAETFNVQHESPQALLIIDGKCVYHESHMGISLPEILSQASYV